MSFPCFIFIPVFLFSCEKERLITPKDSNMTSAIRFVLFTFKLLF